jgi:hypothetical protein
MISCELAKGETPDVDKLNNTDLKVMVHWFKWNGDKAMSKNKYGLLLRYCEICTCVVATVSTYWEDSMVGVDVAVADGVATATGVRVRVPTADVGGTGMIWSRGTDTAAAAQPSLAAATRTTVAAAQPPSDASTRTTAAAQPTSTQGKPTFAAAAEGIPDAAHTTEVAARPPPAAAFSIHNNGDDDWDFAPIDLTTLGIAAATGQDGHHADHCGLQVLN